MEGALKENDALMTEMQQQVDNTLQFGRGYEKYADDANYQCEIEDEKLLFDFQGMLKGLVKRFDKSVEIFGEQLSLISNLFLHKSRLQPCHWDMIS